MSTNQNILNFKAQTSRSLRIDSSPLFYCNLSMLFFWLLTLHILIFIFECISLNFFFNFFILVFFFLALINSQSIIVLISHILFLTFVPASMKQFPDALQFTGTSAHTISPLFIDLMLR